MAIKEFFFSESLKNKGVTNLFLKDNEIVIEINNNIIKTKMDSDSITTINNVENNLDNFTINNIIKQELILNISKNLEQFFFEEKNSATPIIHGQSEITNKNVDQIDNNNNKVNIVSKPSISFEQWQLELKKKLDDLKLTTNDNFSDLWDSVEFVLSVKNILHIKNCTLPFAGIILGSPSSSKTIGLELLRDKDNTFYTDSFSAKSFVSHSTSIKREDLVHVDLLPKIKNKIFLSPELSPTFSKKDDEVIEILGIFIRVLDGRGYESDTGAHGHRGYTGEFMFVWIGAAVDVPRKVHKYLAALGPKLYFYRVPKSKKTEQDYIKELEGEEFGPKFEKIKNKLSEYLEWFDLYPIETLDNQNNNALLKIPWDDKKDDKKAYTFIVRLAQILAPLRGTLTTWETRDTQGTEYAYALPIVEEPSRAITQLKNLARGHALISGRNYITLDDIPILIKVVLSTASIERVKIFDLLLSADGQLSTSQITKALDISSNTAKRTMTEFKGLGIVDWVQEDDGDNGAKFGYGYNNLEKIVKLKNKFLWFLTDEFKSLRNGFSVDVEHNDNKKQLPQEKIPLTTLLDSIYRSD
jgi:predicted transcriptional regulator